MPFYKVTQKREATHIIEAKDDLEACETYFDDWEFEFTGDIDVEEVEKPEDWKDE